MTQSGDNHHDEDKLLEAVDASKSLKLSEDNGLREEASSLARQLFDSNIKKRARFVNQLIDICNRVQDRDFLLIHNPGGWGCTPFEELLNWERSVVEGVSDSIKQLGYSSLFIQHFRSSNNWWAHIRDFRDESSFFRKGKTCKTGEIIAELKFILEHNDYLRVLLVGASQGAAFSNAIMRQLDGLPRVYSLEFGIFFPHMAWRVVTERTLAIDSNGQMPDPIAHRNLKIGIMAYITSPYLWVKYRLEGRPQKLTYCVNAPGHNYDWEYPEVQRRVKDFLETKFGPKGKVKVRVQ
ncbi:MAG: hypothetical protein HY662_01235 [Chloroflexi bacterium]|nr:hypothetical protein [Chloroflexota bacterium]